MLYELMFIAGKDAEAPFLSKVEKILKDAGAEDIKVDRMGKKTLAYPISRQSEGEYFLLNFKAEGEAIGALREMFMLEKEAVLRYLITKTKISKKVTKGRKEPSSFTKVTEDKKETKKLKAVVTVRTKVREDKKESKGKKTASSKSQKGEKAKGKDMSKKKNN